MATAQSLPASFKAFLMCRFTSAEFITVAALNFEQMSTTRHYDLDFVRTENAIRRHGFVTRNIGRCVFARQHDRGDWHLARPARVAAQKRAGVLVRTLFGTPESRAWLRAESSKMLRIIRMAAAIALVPAGESEIAETRAATVCDMVKVLRLGDFSTGIGVLGAFKPQSIAILSFRLQLSKHRGPHF
jgi:hypothetical protein